MNNQEKLEFLISPEKFFPADLHRGALLGNQAFITATEQYLDILSESQYWPREKIEELQIKRLNRLRDNIENRSSFWASFFRKYGINKAKNKITLTDLKRLPILRRQDLINFGESIYTESNDKHLFSHTSSGTTGIPLKFIFSEREMLISFPYFFRHPVFEKLSLREVLSRKPFVVLGFPGFSYICKKDFFYRAFTAIQSFDLDHPVVLPLLAVRISSESISLAERQTINAAFNVPIINTLSGNGNIRVGFECPINPGQFHVNSESVILEIAGCDDDTLSISDRGELVATDLTYISTPRIRWAHGDLGKFLSGICSCGRTLPIFEFHGRRGHEVVLPSGRSVKWILLHTALMRGGLLGRSSKQIQVIQDKIDNLRISIIPLRPFSDSDEINIRLACTNLFNNEKVNIKIEYVNKITHSGRKPKIFIPLSEFQERKL